MARAEESREDMAATPPLIALMSGAKVRAWRRTVIRPKEIKLQVQVADLLRAHCLPDWRWTHINRTAKDARQGKIFKTMGVNPGWADFELISPEPLPYFVELKRLGEDVGKDSPQDNFRLWCIAHGIPYLVAWTMDRVLAAFDDWGCLRVVLPKFGAQDGC